MGDPDDVDFTDPEETLAYLRREWADHVEDENTTAYVGIVGGDGGG